MKNASTISSKMDPDIVAIAIDSTGLKRFGRDEWHSAFWY